MYKLKYQWLALFALVVSAAIVYYIYPMFKATMFETPVITFVIGQIGVLLTLAFLFYEKGSLAQQFKAFFLMLSISMGLGALANFLGQSHNVCTFVPGSTVFHIALKLSWAQLLLMTMAALTTTITLCKLAPVTYVADPDVLNKLKGKGQQMAPVIENTEVAESEVDWETAKDASDLMPKPKPTTSQSGLKAASTSQTKLDALEASAAPTPSPVAEDAAGAQYQDRRGAASKPSSTADRLQAQKRRNTSTFTKLQALSASGTGSLRKPSALEQQSEEAPQSLSTLLNRLDDEDTPVPATPTATPPKPAQPKPEPIQPPEEILITTLFGEEAQLGLDVAEQAETGFSLMDRLAAEEEVSGIEVAEPAAAVDEYNIDEPVFNATEAAEAPQAVAEQYNADQALSMEPSAVLEETAFAEPAPEPVAQIAEPVAEAVPVEPEPAPAPPPPPEPAPVTPPAAPVAETKPATPTRPVVPPSQQPISVAAGLVQHSSPLAAKESADPGIAPSLMSLLDSAAERAGIDETAQPATQEVAPTSPVAPPPAPEAVIPAVDSVAPAAVESESQQKLFSAGLDSDLDDVFSGLAPAEAQREVSASTLPTAEPSSPSLEAEPEKKGLFGQEVGSEIDDIFNGLAPPEAHREVSKVSTGDHKPIDVAPETAAAEPAPVAKAPEPAPVAKAPEPAPVAKAPEPAPVAKAPEPAETEEQKGLFEANALSNEIDDIFSGLASPEAQREVSDVLKKPAAQPESESMAPPEDESKGLFQESALNSEIDDIFSGLASADAQRDVSQVTLAQLKGDNQSGGSLATGELPQPTPENLIPDKSSFVGTGDVPVLDEKVQAQMAANPRPSKPTDTAGNLPSMPADVVLNPTPPATPAASAAETPKAEGKPTTGAVTQPKEVKEFGRLSNRSAVQPKVTGEGAGTMKTVGKLLLDTQAVENIIQAGQTKRPIGSGLTTARVISATRGEGIKALLTRIDTYPGVAGSLIVGHDGLVIASTVTGMDKDMLGALSTALLSTSNLTTKKLEIGKLRQMVLLTEIQNTDGSIQPKTTVLTDVDVGILAVFLEQTELEKLDGLITEIHETING